MPPSKSWRTDMHSDWPSSKDLVSPSPSPTALTASYRVQKENKKVASQKSLKAKETLRGEIHENQEDEVEAGSRGTYGTVQRQRAQLSTSTHPISKNCHRTVSTTTSSTLSAHPNRQPSRNEGSKIQRYTSKHLTNTSASRGSSRGSLALLNVSQPATGLSDSRPALIQIPPQTTRNSSLNKFITSYGSSYEESISQQAFSRVEVAASSRSHLVSGTETEPSRASGNGRNIDKPVNRNIIPVVSLQENTDLARVPPQDSRLKLATVAFGAPNSLWSQTPTFGDLLSSDAFRCLTASQKKNLVNAHCGDFKYLPNPPRQPLIQPLIHGQALSQTPKNHANIFPQLPFGCDSQSLELDRLSCDLLRLRSENTSTSIVDKEKPLGPNTGIRHVGRAEDIDPKGSLGLVSKFPTNGIEMQSSIEGHGHPREQGTPINDSTDPSTFYGKKLSVVSRPYHGDPGPSSHYQPLQNQYQPTSALPSSIWASQKQSGLPNLERFKYSGPSMKQNETWIHLQKPAHTSYGMESNHVSNMSASHTHVQEPSERKAAASIPPSKLAVMITSQAPSQAPVLGQNIHQDKGPQPAFWSSARVEIPTNTPERIATKPFDPRFSLKLNPKGMPKKRGRPFQTPEAAARAAAKAARLAGRGDGESVKKKVGRPSKSFKHVEVPVPEPQFMVFCCEWEGCSAELHNAETLRLHLHAVHGRAIPATQMVPCLWKGCCNLSNIKTGEGKTIELRERREFHDRKEWKAHLDETHMDRVLRAQGDGPKSQDLSWPRKKCQREAAPWLFDENGGKQATPSVKYQEIDHGIAKQVNAKRFVKKKRGGLHSVYDSIEVPQVHKRARMLDEDEITDLDSADCR